MAEVIRRRFDKADAGRPWPDLLLVDGGKGQLNVARAILAELGLTGQFDMAGIAKKDSDLGEQHDKIYLVGRANPVQFGRDADILLFLQHIRDEAHRWAVSFQRRAAMASPCIRCWMIFRESAPSAKPNCCNTSAAWSACAPQHRKSFRRLPGFRKSWPSPLRWPYLPKAERLKQKIAICGKIPFLFVF
jgi:hypothetical protein